MASSWRVEGTWWRTQQPEIENMIRIYSWSICLHERRLGWYFVSFVAYHQQMSGDLPCWCNEWLLVAENRGMEANKRTHVVFKGISADMIAYAHRFEGYLYSSLFLRCSLDDSCNHLHRGDLTHHGRQRTWPSRSFSWCFWISFSSWISTSHLLTCLSFTFYRRTIIHNNIY